MKLLTKKTTFLLKAPLEVLHSESVEWLEEIEFWKDEVAFFYKLIMKETKENPDVFKTKEAKEVEKKLIQVAVHSLDELKLEVTEHEKFLARLMENSKLDAQLYHDRHASIVSKFAQFGNEYKQMKKEVFRLAEKAHNSMLQKID
jgi:hypothetical protein